MIRVSIELTGDWQRFSEVSPLQVFGKDEMQQIGKFVVRTVKARVAQGIGSDDRSMPPLKTVGISRTGKPRQIKYAQQKASRGLQPIRDLRGPGNGPHMMDEFDVVDVAEGLVVIGFATSDAKKKAAINERRARFIGFSNGDARAVVAYARKLFRAQAQKLSSSQGGK